MQIEFPRASRSVELAEVCNRLLLSILPGHISKSFPVFACKHSIATAFLNTYFEEGVPIDARLTGMKAVLKGLLEAERCAVQERSAQAARLLPFTIPSYQNIF